MMLIEKRALVEQWPGQFGGFKLEALMYPDQFAEISHFDECFNAEQKAAYEDSWWYTTVVVQAWRSGVQLGDASISGIEMGHIPGIKESFDPLADKQEYWHVPAEGGETVELMTFANGYGIDLIHQAVEEAQSKLDELIRSEGERLLSEYGPNSFVKGEGDTE